MIMMLSFLFITFFDCTDWEGPPHAILGLVHAQLHKHKGQVFI